MKFHILLIFTILSQLLFSQSPKYFQQEVNYKIEATLNDTDHILDGNIEIEYTNNSPDELSEIWMHLWPNAYKNINTSFAKQKVRTGEPEFYFAKEHQMGYLDSLNFMLNSEITNWNYDEEHIDIAKINLKTPLKSGSKIIIKTPFKLKIPDSFSRLGHIEESYQLTQWFPKPAVYDHKGWHAMPYLDMGEFYSEFGSFDVKITLPENYVIGATGVLQNESELDFLAKKTEKTVTFFKELDKKKFKAEFQLEDYLLELDTFPNSSSKFKTLHYKAENVHDFAWFADKRFHVQKGEAHLNSGKKVDTWTMFTNQDAHLWKNSIDYVIRAVEFYSKHVGEYPWAQATGLQSALSAGGGMEYPMVTVIGDVLGTKDLDQVLTHEVGHNWFYGILASNERDYAWLDEGLNSFYEYRYLKQYYGSRLVEDMAPHFLQKDTKIDLLETAFLTTARAHQNQPPETHSNHFHGANYGVESYIKVGSALQHLEAYLGTESFDKAMKAYYQKWKFQHPYPEDLRKIFEEETEKSLAWFFEGYLNSNKVLDYALSHNFEKEVTIRNKGKMTAPMPIAALKDGKVVETIWSEGAEIQETIRFKTDDIDEFLIDPDHLTLDLYRKNNNIKTTGLFKRSEPLTVKLVPTLENPRAKELFILPAMGWNVYDKFMLGATFYNRTLPSKKFEYSLSPLYSFATKDLNGIGDIAYHIYADKNNGKLTLAANVKSFNQIHRDSIKIENGVTSFDQKYLKVAPSITYVFPRSYTKNSYKKLSYRLLWINEEAANFDSLGHFTKNDWEDRLINEFTFEFGNKRVLNPFSGKFQVEQQKFTVFGKEENTIRATFEFNTEYTYAEKRSVNFRFYGGYFFKNAFRKRGVLLPNSFNLVGQGFNDYKYDELYFGRNETDDFWSNQVALRDGGLKAPFGSPINDGRSNNFVFAVNAKADLPQDLPFNLPAKPYFDFAFFKESRPSVFNSSDFDKATQFWWSFGIALEWGDIVGIYFPLVSSSTGFNNVDDLYKQKGNYWSRISWRINFRKLNPWRVADEMVGL